MWPGPDLVGFGRRWLIFRTHADVDNGPSQLSIVHPDGSGLRHLTPADGTVLSSAFSPDGKWIAYGAQGVDFTPDVFVMRSDGSDKHPLTRTKLWDSAPDWGP